MVKINRYRIWGVVYIVLLIVSSPATTLPGDLCSAKLLPYIREFQHNYLSHIPFIPKNDLVQKFSIQALICNFFLIIFSISETFWAGKKTQFDIVASFIFGATALLNAFLLFAIYTPFNFLYLTLLFSTIYTISDIAGIRVSQKIEPLKTKTFQYSLAFVDSPTLLVCIGFLAPVWFSPLSYPENFTDGIGSAILLFSGCAWTFLMVFFVAAEEKVA